MPEPTPKRPPSPPVEDPLEARSRTLIAKLLVCERDLILLRLASERLRLLTSELGGEFRGAGRVVCGRQTISGAFAQGIERSICCAHTLLSDGRLLGGRVAWAREQALNRWQHQRTILRALLVSLRDELVLLRELLIGELARRMLSST